MRAQGLDPFAQQVERLTQVGHHDVTLLHFEEVGSRRFSNWTMGQVNLAKVNPSTLLKYSEMPGLDPFRLSGDVSLALLEEMIATAAICGRAG